MAGENTMPTTSDAVTLGQRLRVSRARIAELEELIRAEYDLRNDLIVTACEEARMSQRDVARHAGVRQQRIHAILAAN